MAMELGTMFSCTSIRSGPRVIIPYHTSYLAIARRGINIHMDASQRILLIIVNTVVGPRTLKFSYPIGARLLIWRYRFISPVQKKGMASVDWHRFRSGTGMGRG